MKKIFIYAYSKLNLGDDLFVKILCERYPQHQFYIVCRKKDAIAFSDIKNLEIIYSIPYLDALLYKLSLQHFFINRVVKNCDLVVNIGGSLFIEPKKWQKHVNEYRKRINVDKPFFIIGSNFGPYKNNDFHTEYQNIFKKVDDVCFRDYYSYELFSELENIRLAPDVVFTLDAENISQVNTNDYFVISVIDLENRQTLSKYKEIYEKRLAEVTVKLVNRGYDVILMSFCEQEGDLQAIKRINEKLSNKIKTKVTIYNYAGSLNESLSIIKSSKGVVATRFHSLILAWLFGVPVYPLIYSSKTKNTLKDSEFQGKSAPIYKLEEIDSSEVVSQLINGNRHNINIQIKSAQKQFLKLDEELI